jgi:hypothetical protein
MTKSAPVRRDQRRPAGNASARGCMDVASRQQSGLGLLDTRTVPFSPRISHAPCLYVSYKVSKHEIAGPPRGHMFYSLVYRLSSIGCEGESGRRPPDNSDETVATRH